MMPFTIGRRGKVLLQRQEAELRGDGCRVVEPEIEFRLRVKGLERGLHARPLVRASISIQVDGTTISQRVLLNHWQAVYLHLYTYNTCVCVCIYYCTYKLCTGMHLVLERERF